jgi:hypothetical protein
LPALSFKRRHYNVLGGKRKKFAKRECVYCAAVKIDERELTHRLAEADLARVALRKTTLELVAAGRSLLDERKKDETDDADRPERSHRGIDRRVSST